MEQRLQLRFPFKAPVSYQTLGASSSSLAQGQSLDISDGGISILDGLRLEKGVLIQMMLPISGSTVTVPVISEVRWSEATGSGSYRVGLRFLK